MRAEELALAFKAKWWRIGSGWSPSMDAADIVALLRDAEVPADADLVTSRAVADEWRAKAEKLLVLCRQLEADLGEARVGRENWKQVCRQVEDECRSNDRVANGALLRELKRSGTHSRACAIRAVGGYPAGWIDSESQRCTCSLGETIRKAEGR